MWRWLWGLVALLFVLLSLTWAMTRVGQEGDSETERIVSVALALACGGLGDRAVNDSVYHGLQQAVEELGLRSRICEYRGAAEQRLALMELAQERHDLIIAIGAENEASVRVTAARFPDRRFALIDAVALAPNVTSVVFRELEADFLAGALTGLLATGGTVGFLAATDTIDSRAIEHGWRQGVLHVLPQARLLAAYGQADCGPDRSREDRIDAVGRMAEDLYLRGAQVIYAAAGQATPGAIAASEAAGGILVAVGSNHHWRAPHSLAGRRVKDFALAVRILLEDLQAGRLEPGIRRLTLAEGAVGLSDLEPSLVAPSVSERLDTIEQLLVNGEITVGEYR